MAGRHLITESTKSPARKYGFAGVASASVVGALVGFVAPSAFAAPDSKDADTPDPALVAGTLTLEEQPKEAEVQSVEVKGGTSGDGWEIAEAAVEVTEPAPEPEPLAQTRGGNAQAAAQGVTGPTQAAVPSDGTLGSKIVAIARQYQGVPYVWGGSTPAGFDCSGFTSYVYAQVGISLPRTDAGQRGAGTVVPASQAQPGDLMWWPGHVAIYTGNGMHIAAHRPGKPLSEIPNYGAPTYIRLAG
ncbi:MAG: NlpC/P60 family protein [Actinomycetaceae bacterium]|nr:NlpC/P60 family protein [Actinomycetaceae bacterium]MDY6142711.1 NlpC/P60 family protein [Arcanobacterium sp.]